MTTIQSIINNSNFSMINDTINNNKICIDKKQNMMGGVCKASVFTGKCDDCGQKLGKTRLVEITSNIHVCKDCVRQYTNEVDECGL